MLAEHDHWILLVRLEQIARDHRSRDLVQSPCRLVVDRSLLGGLRSISISSNFGSLAHLAAGPGRPRPPSPQTDTTSKPLPYDCPANHYGHVIDGYDDIDPPYIPSRRFRPPADDHYGFPGSHHTHGFTLPCHSRGEQPSLAQELHKYKYRL